MADQVRYANSKPLQRLSWDDKIANNKQWFKENANYYISASSFQGYKSTDGSPRAHLQTMYNIYNNQIPLEWFSHITDPLSAQDPLHKRFPAKIRPTNILRTNIDLLLGEWPNRPFKWRVENMGESGYNSFLDERNKAVEGSVQQLFMAHFQQALLQQGEDPENVSKITPDQVPLPADVQETFQASYKDKLAIKAQKFMKRALAEYNIKRTLHKIFKDWLIAGEAATYKGVHNGDLYYRRLSPLYLDYDKSPDTDFVEDGEWATYMFLMTTSDVVDMFYDEMDEDMHKKLEMQTYTASPRGMYDYLNGLYKDNSNKVPVYLVTWKGRKKHIIAKYTDPLTGQPQEVDMDEAEYQAMKDQLPGAEFDILWVNEAYETWRIGDSDNDMFVRMQPVPAQRNALNNFSTCKLPVNARKYSDTHSENISVVQIGIPYLIMYIIVTRTLELTIAKNKGKILLMDNNAIPRDKGWDEEKFFYYSEAMGYGLLDRNQIGVDKSWNQYTVVDMTLFDSIEQLITLQQHFKQEWDDIIGISKQRKGQTFASETGTANENAIFQSNVITEMIYSSFEEFTQRELQGILDLSKYINVDGLRRLYNSDDVRDELLQIEPGEFADAELGIFMSDDKSDANVLDMMKAESKNFIQNGAKPSTILEILQAGNIAALNAKLKYIEQIEAQAEQQNQQAEADAQEQADERKLRFLEYEKMLEEQLIEVEWDRRDQNEQVKGAFNIESFGKGIDQNGNGIPDATELVKQQTEQSKIASAERQKLWELGVKERLGKIKEFLTSQDKAADRASNEKIAKEANQTKLKGDRIKARSKSTTKK